MWLHILTCCIHLVSKKHVFKIYSYSPKMYWSSSSSEESRNSWYYVYNICSPDFNPIFLFVIFIIISSPLFHFMRKRSIYKTEITTIIPWFTGIFMQLSWTNFIFFHLKSALFTQWKDTFGMERVKRSYFFFQSNGLDNKEGGHLAMTYSALCSLLILDEDLSCLPEKQNLLGWVRMLQQPDGRYDWIIST